MYLSKGIVLRPSPIDSVLVHRCGTEYRLTPEQSRIWLSGRFSVGSAEEAADRQALGELANLGLAEFNADDDPSSVYRILSNCVLCKAELKMIHAPLSPAEKKLWVWIDQAGFMLTVCELVYLMEHRIKPEPNLLGKQNWHTLVSTIYTTETIFDGILLSEMEHAPACTETVESILGLLRKKRLILI